MMRMGKIFIVSGFSGSGKGTLVNNILEKIKDIQVVKSYTTRPKRSEDDFYNFISEEEFAELENKKLLLESNVYNGFRYGTLITDVMSILQEGKSVILEIDFNGCEQVLKSELFEKERMSTIFVVTDAKRLYRRLLNRGTEDLHKIKSRLSTAKEECNHMQSYESIIYNDNLDTSIEKMLQFVDGRRLNDEFDIERFQREIDEIIWKLK